MRCPRSTAARFAAAVAVGLFGLATGRATAQDLPPIVVLSTDAALPATGKPEASGALNLLPNAQLSYYLYVHNPSADDNPNPFTVILSKDKLARDVIATAKVQKLAKKATIRLPLTPLAAAPAPVPAPVKNPDGTTPAPKADLGTLLPRKVFITVRDDSTNAVYKGWKIDDNTYDINVDPGKFLSASAASTKSVNNEVTITVTLTQPTRGATLKPDAPGLNVKLDIRPELIPGLDPTSVKDGIYESVFAPDSTDVRLVARNLRSLSPGGDLTGKVAVAVNGFERAFAFDIKTSGTDASPSSAPFVRIDVPRYAVPGKPLSARLEILNVDNSAVPELKFDRRAGGEPEVVTRRVYDKAGINTRNVKLYAKFEATGEIVLSSTVQDWIVPLDTKGIYGDGILSLKVGNQPAVNATVTFDDTPPVVAVDGFKAIIPGPKPKKKADAKLPVEPVIHTFPLEAGRPVPARIAKGEVLRIAARAEDLQSNLNESKVLFFLGDSPTADGKPAAGGKVEEGLKRSEIRLSPSAPKTTILPPSLFKGDWFEAEFDTSELPKGKHKVGVRFLNQAGLATEVIREVIVYEPPAPRVLGDIKVLVTAGYSPERPQPGLTVTALVDGKPVDAGKTSSLGEYTFKDLKPGTYTIFAVKPADGNARAFSVVKVVADEEVVTSLSLKR